jgi:hypothetical protein
LITDEEDDIAYAFTYMMKLVNVLTTWSCTAAGSLPEDLQTQYKTNYAYSMLKAGSLN